MLTMKKLLYPLALACFMLPAVSHAQKPAEKSDGITVSSPQAEGIDPALLDSLDAAIRNKKFENLNSVLIARHGKLVYEKYYNGFSDSSLHDTRSSTKTLISILIGMAIDQKLIASEKAPAFAFYKERSYAHKDPRKEKITIEDLLSMSSPLECDDDNQFSAGNEERMYLTEDYIQFLMDLPIRGIAPFATKPEDQPYGRSFNYCTAGTVYLGAILTKASHTTVEKFAEKNLFGPLGIHHYKWQYIPGGMVMTGGGMRLHSRDYLKLAQLYLNRGSYNGKQLVSADWVLKSVTPKANARDNVDYGYLWWLQEFGRPGKEHKAFYMSGNGGSKIAAFPDLDLVVVLTSARYGNYRGHLQTEKALSEYIVPSVN